MPEETVFVNGQEFPTAFDGLLALAGPGWETFVVQFRDGGCCVEALIEPDGCLLIRLYRVWDGGDDLSGIFDFVSRDGLSVILVHKITDTVYIRKVDNFAKKFEYSESFDIVQTIYKGHLSPRVV